MVSYMAPLPEMLAIRPPRSTDSWIEYPLGTLICASGAAAGAAGFWATAMHAAARNIATSIPRNIAKDGC